MATVKSALTLTQRLQSVTGGDAIAFQNNEAFAVCGDSLLRIGLEATPLCCIVSTKVFNDAFAGDGLNVTVEGVNNGVKSSSIRLSFNASTKLVTLPSQDINGHPLANGGFAARLTSLFKTDSSTPHTFPVDSFAEACGQVQADLEGEVSQLQYTQALLVIMSGREYSGGIPPVNVITVVGQTPQRSVKSQELPLYPNLTEAPIIETVFGIGRKYVEAVKGLVEVLVQGGDDMSISIGYQTSSHNEQEPTALWLSGGGVDYLVPISSTDVDRQLYNTASMYESILTDQGSTQTLLDYRFEVPPDLISAIQQGGKLTKLPLAFTIIDNTLVVNTVPSDPIHITQSFTVNPKGMTYPPFEVFARVMGKSTYGSWMCPYYNGATNTVDYILLMSDGGDDLRNTVISAISTVHRNVGAVGGGLASDPTADGAAIPAASDDDIPF